MTGSSGYLPGLGGAIIFLMWWAAIGALATLGGAIWLIVWAVHHVHIGVSL